MPDPVTPAVRVGDRLALKVEFAPGYGWNDEMTAEIVRKTEEKHHCRITPPWIEWIPREDAMLIQATVIEVFDV